MTVFLLLASLILYAAQGARGLIWLLGSVALSYGVGLAAPKRRWASPVGVALSIAGLLVLRFQSFWGGSILAPLGVSYFTLRIISYQVDVARGMAPEKNILKYSLYVTYLPCLFLGPIETYDDFSRQFYRERQLNGENFANGAVRILWGGFKKLVIATRAGVIVAAVRENPQMGGVAVLLALMTYSVQLYADFSGGMDMILGISQMLGIRLTENFRTPFFSQSVGEFWRRWHITLGKWLTSYVYIPLGGSRKGKLRTVLNTLITFLVSGIWHGTSYWLWGLCHGTAVSVGRFLPKESRHPHLRQIRTFLLVSLFWVFFIWQQPTQAVGALISMVKNIAVLPELSALGLSLGNWIVYLLATAVLWTADLRSLQVPATPWKKLAVAAVLGLGILTFGMYGIGFVSEAFIYSRF